MAGLSQCLGGGECGGAAEVPRCLLFAGVRGEECRKSGSDSGGDSEGAIANAIRRGN